MTENIVAEIRADVEFMFKKADLSKLFYHNLTHTLEVTANTVSAAKSLSYSDNLINLLETAALFHDTGYLHSYHGHEDKSKEIAVQYLKSKGLQGTAIIFVTDCIEATKMHAVPQNEAEALLKDVDLAFGITENFFERGPLLRKEWEACLEKFYTDEEWEQLQFDFLSSVKFYSDFAKMNFMPKVLKNLEQQKLRI